VRTIWIFGLPAFLMTVFLLTAEALALVVVFALPPVLAAVAFALVFFVV
jgi:hypothetical protein